jgi:hypothetical protein
MNYYKLLRYIDRHKGVDDNTLKAALKIDPGRLGDLAQGSSLNYLFRYPKKKGDPENWCSELTSDGRVALEQMKTVRHFNVLSCVLAAVAAVASIIGLFIR